MSQIYKAFKWFPVIPSFRFLGSVVVHQYLLRTMNNYTLDIHRTCCRKATDGHSGRH